MIHKYIYIINYVLFPVHTYIDRLLQSIRKISRVITRGHFTNETKYKSVSFIMKTKIHICYFCVTIAWYKLLLIVGGISEFSIF